MELRVTNIDVQKHVIETPQQKTHALSFNPVQSSRQLVAVFTHGYTSHKDSILSWASRFAQEGIPCVLFDLPGHRLGHFYETPSLEVFTKETPQLFAKALSLVANEETTTVVLGGHSLGALMATHALKSEAFKQYERLGICVGYGMAPSDRPHVFSSNFFAKTMEVRGQLVDHVIRPEEVFPWIKEQKETLQISGEKFFVLNGLDDVVVGRGAGERLKDKLVELGNEVDLDEPQNLPHHQPERAAPHLFAYIKKNYLA